MKTYRVSVFALFAFFLVLPAFAQDSAKETAQSGELWSEYYYVNVPLEKVYPHHLGYVISYRKGGAKIGQAYIPLKWFNRAGGKGELIRLTTGTEWPYMTVYYKSGQFSHIRLFVRGNLSHESWGNLPQGMPGDEKFDIEELKLEY